MIGIRGDASCGLCNGYLANITNGPCFILIVAYLARSNEGIAMIVANLPGSLTSVEQ